MVLVPANMSRFGFSSCKVFLYVLVPAKYFVFENSLWSHFCDDLHTWHMMTEPIL